MSILETIIFFLIIWWPIFFILLPIGYKPITDDDSETKFVKSAPTRPRVLFKFLAATFLSFIITFLVWILDYFDLFSIKNFLL